MNGAFHIFTNQQSKYSLFSCAEGIYIDATNTKKYVDYINNCREFNDELSARKMKQIECLFDKILILKDEKNNKYKVSNLWTNYSLLTLNTVFVAPTGLEPVSKV